MSIHNFGKSLKRGQAGEQEILQIFSALKKTDGRTGDMILNEQKVELKTDYYSAQQTENFFLERFSNKDKGTNGGPWQALDHGCEYFLYYFIADKQGWCFNTKQLVSQLESFSDLKPIEIKNPKHTTIGYKVLRSKLTPVFTWEGIPAKFVSGDETVFSDMVGR